MKINLDYLGNVQTLWEKKKSTLQAIDNKYKNFTGKLWAIGDLHLPFGYVPSILHAVEKLYESKKRGVKNLIVASGDWLTFDTFSSFLHLKRTHTVSQEIDRLKYALETFREYGEIIYIKSNHEMRFEKWLARNTDGKADDIKAMGASFENILKDVDITLLDNWFVKVADCIVCHPESGSMVRGRTGDWVAERFYNAVQNWRVAFVAHTHKQNVLWHKGRLVVECGALCKTQDYATNGKVASWRSEGQYYGYGEGVIKKGVADLNTCRFEHCGFEPPLL